MNRKLGPLTFLLGIVLGALAMRGWLHGMFPIPGLPAPSTLVADANETPRTGETPPASGGVNVAATSLPTPTQAPTPTPTPTLEPVTGPTPSFGGLTLLEKGWLFTAPERIVIGPEVLANGIINLVSENGTVYRLNPDGTAREELTLPNFTYAPENFHIPIYFYDDGTIVVRAPDKIYAINPDGSLRWEIPLTLVAEGSVQFLAGFGDVFLQVDSSLTLYAYTLADGLLWQYTFEESFREDFFHPTTGASHAYYVDRQGTVHAFTREGLAWTYDPEEGLKAASNILIAPDGNLYYVLTNGTNGRLQSLTPNGEPRWRTDLNTFRFFTTPDHSTGGQYIYVTDDLIRADTGELAPVEFPYQVDAFIRGEDGFDYLLTGDNVIRWQVGAEGFESLHTSRFNSEGLTTFSPPRIRIYPSQITEMEYFTQNGAYLVWLSPEGKVMNAMQLAWNVVRINLQEAGEVSLTVCERRLIEKQLTCRKYVAGNQDPVWETTFEGITGGFNPFGGLLFQGGQMYALTGEMNLYVLPLERP